MKKILFPGRTILSHLFLVLFFSIASLDSFGQATKQCVTPLQNGDKVLFIGNSFTEWSGPLPNVIQSLITASGSGLSVTFTTKVKGMGIYKEYATWSTLGMIAEIQKGGWKYVVLQGWEDAIKRKDQSVTELGVPVADYIGYPQCQDTMLKYLLVLDAAIKSVGAKTILYEPHVGKTAFFQDMTKSHSTYAKLQYNVSSFYAPIVNAWDTIRRRYPAADSGCTTFTPGSFADFLYGDCGHQSTNGIMLDALTFYTIFTQRSASTLKPLFLTSMTRPDLYEEFARVGYNTGKTILSANGCGFTDTQVPTVPTTLTASTVLPDFFNLTWAASTDDIGVLGYEVYRDGVLLGVSSTPKYAVGGLSAATKYTMTVKAFDSEGKKSALSTALDVTTSALSSVDTSGMIMAWDFAGQTGNATMATTDFMTGISGTAPSAVVSISSKFIASSFGTNSFSMRNQDKTTLADAITAEHYITFSVSPQAGNELSIDSIKIRPFSQNQVRNFTLMSSVGGFTNGNEIQTIQSAGQSGTALQKIVVAGISNQSTAIEFRVYVWGPANVWEAFGLGNGDGGITPKDLLVYGKIKSSALPSFPTNLTATNLTETGFTLNWKAAKNAVSYEVFKNGVSAGTTSSLTMNIMGVTINATYSMTVKATDGVGTVSEESIPLSVKIPDTHTPSVPINLTVTGITDNSFILHWNACTDNVAVTLYEINMDGNTYGNTADNYLPVPFLTANTNYSMTVRSKDAAGNVSAFSTALVVKTLAGADVTAPTAPTNLVSSGKTNTTASLSWTASTDNVAVTYYLIYQAGIKIDSTSSLTYTATGLTASTTYAFTVKARDAAGNISALSNTLNVTTAATLDTQAPTVPSGLASPSKTSTTVNLT